VRVFAVPGTRRDGFLSRYWLFTKTVTGEVVVKIVLRERESAQEAVRRLRKILDRSGLKRELRRRERYEKPSAVKRQAKNRAIRRTKAQARAATGARP
jgi:small subunit ribosomal protein S21